MNKRIKKKIKNRLGFKKYIEYRKYFIAKCIQDKYNTKSNDIIFITTSRKNKFKHINNIKIFKNCYPVSIK